MELLSSWFAWCRHDLIVLSRLFVRPLGHFACWTRVVCSCTRSCRSLLWCLLKSEPSWVGGDVVRPYGLKADRNRSPQLDMWGSWVLWGSFCNVWYLLGSCMPIIWIIVCVFAYISAQLLCRALIHKFWSEIVSTTETSLVQVFGYHVRSETRSYAECFTY